MLEILEGGNYGRTQRYTTRRGNMYVRCLAASWDASNPQWEPWLRVGHQSESRYYEGDLNVLTDPGIYSVTGKATNGPMLDTVGATLLGILEVIRRFDGVSVWQRYTTTGNQKPHRDALLSASTPGANGPNGEKYITPFRCL